MEVTRIPHSIFWEARAVPSASLIETAQRLYDTFACFKEQDRGGGGAGGAGGFGDRRGFRDRNGGGERGGDRHRPVMSEKPKIGTKELSRELIAQKDFLSVLNKITQANKRTLLATLVKQLRPEFGDMYMNVLWDHLARTQTYQEVLMDVLHTLQSQGLDMAAFVHRKWDEYLAARAWNPPAAGEGGDYDVFCDAVKWRKRSLCTLRVWKMFADVGLLTDGEACQLFEEIAHDVESDIGQEIPDYKRCEVLLEQLYCGLELFGAAALPWMAQWIEHFRPRAAALPPVVRFKIYDIHEKLI